ncbi:MAG: aldehyde:ferredoxin oxidoreductase [Halanaerobium sp. T82-1]|nr:MAG: aldehyde:ferredoxin oxidoreductase [Halanaerobium sp. T82-1]
MQATQFEYSSESLLETGERIYNLERQFNLEAGILPEEDKLPARFDEPLPDGPQKGISTKYREILPEYYEIRGWQEDGWISEQKLKDILNNNIGGVNNWLLKNILQFKVIQFSLVNPSSSLESWMEFYIKGDQVGIKS